MYRGVGVYRHYKGGMYEVLGLGLEEATHDVVVLYRPASGAMPPDVLAHEPGVAFWTRPLEDFNAEVPVGGTEEKTRTAQRFEKIGDH